MAKVLPTTSINIASCNKTTHKELGSDNKEYDCIDGCFTFDLDLSAEYVNPKDNTKTCHIRLAFVGENEGDFLAGFLGVNNPVTDGACVDRNGVVTFFNANSDKFLNEVKVFIVDAETNEPYKVLGPMNFASLKVFDPVEIANS